MRTENTQSEATALAMHCLHMARAAADQALAAEGRALMDMAAEAEAWTALAKAAAAAQEEMGRLYSRLEAITAGGRPRQPNTSSDERKITETGRSERNSGC